MKKFFVSLAIFSALIFVISCGSGKKDKKESEPTDDTDVIETDADTEPTDEPTNPTDEPTNPTDEPTNPADEPTNPADEPTNPTDEPTNPADEPTNPTDEPTNPTDEPTNPTDEPTNPTDEPTNPTDEPTNPTDEPTDPTDEPTNPTTPTAEEICSTAGGNWNSTENKCTKTVSCGEIPVAHAEWNGENSYSLVYADGEWNGETFTPAYSETEGTCKYKCAENYYWHESNCVNGCGNNTDDNPCLIIDFSDNNCNPTGATTFTCGCENGYYWNNDACEPTEEKKCDLAGGDWNETESNCTKTVSCDEIPVAHAEWNGEDSYSMEYSGGDWIGEISPEYSETEGNCKYKCSAKYFWNDSICIPYLANICTHQNLCYNNTETISCPAEDSAFYGQDAQNNSSCTAQSFTLETPVEEQNVIVDNNTGLIWEPAPSTTTYYGDQADRHCTDLNNAAYAGINTWRVPHPFEIQTIVDHSKNGPATHEFFTNMPAEDGVFLWIDSGSRYRAFKVYSGTIISRSSSNKYKVVCVSGKELYQSTAEDFEVSATTVKDKRTGLIWQKEKITNKSWEQALTYCKGLNNETESGWRLPNINELMSLLNFDKEEEPYSYFPEIVETTDYNSFWSSTTDASNQAQAWALTPIYGEASATAKSWDQNFVKCVKNAE